MSILIYSLLSSSLYYLGSRALITQPVWSMYPPRFAAFMDCAACTGFWWGVILSWTLGQIYGVRMFELGLDPVTNTIVTGLAMITLNPIAAGLMQRGLDTLGTAFTTEDDDQ